MEVKNKPKSFSLGIRHIEKLEGYAGNNSALIQMLLDKHFEEENKTYEQKSLETEIIVLDIAIKRNFKKYLYSLDVNEQGEFKESNRSMVYMQNLKNLKELFFNAFDELTGYLNEELLKQFMVNHSIGLDECDFPFERIHGTYHENNWEVLKHVHCLKKYFSDKRYFLKLNNNVTKHFVLVFANGEFHANIYSREDDIESEARAMKQYFEQVRADN